MEGDRVAFKFRGDTAPSNAEVVKVRETRERTDAGETVVKLFFDVTECDDGSVDGSRTSGATS